MARRPDKTLPSTPLRVWRERHPETSWEQLARDARLGIATVKRAAAGKPVDEASAAALERVTGVPASELRAGRTSAPIGDRDVKPANVAQPKARERQRPAGERPHTKTKDVATRAAILVYAELAGDEAAAAEFDVADRTIRRWRAELPTDSALARAYARRLDGGWSRKLQSLVEAIAGRAIELVRTAELKAEHLRDLAALLETTAGLLVDREALNRRVKAAGDGDGEDEPPTDRAGETHRADRPSPRAVTAH